MKTMLIAALILLAGRAPAQVSEQDMVLKWAQAFKAAALRYPALNDPNDPLTLKLDKLLNEARAKGEAAADDPEFYVGYIGLAKQALQQEAAAAKTAEVARSQSIQATAAFSGAHAPSFLKPLPQLKLIAPSQAPILVESAASVVARQEREEAAKRERWADRLLQAEMAQIDADERAQQAAREARRRAEHLAPPQAARTWDEMNRPKAPPERDRGGPIIILPTGTGTFFTTDGKGYSVLPGGVIVPLNP